MQAIQRLPTGAAFVRMPDDAVYKIRTRTLPKLPRATFDLTQVKQRYLDQYFEPVAPVASASAVGENIASPRPVPSAVTISRGSEDLPAARLPSGQGRQDTPRTLFVMDDTDGDAA